MNCLYKQLLAFLTARGTFVNFFPSPEKSLFCKDRIESIEWQDLVPRQRTGDCFENHLPRWALCDPLLSSRQTFLLKVLLRQCVFCKALDFGPLADFANWVLRAVSIKTVLIWRHYHRTFRIWVMRNLCGFVRVSIVIPLYIFVLCFWWIAPVSWCWMVTSLCCWTWRCTWRVLRWRCRGRTGTTKWRQPRDNKRYDIFPSCIKSTSLVWSGVASDRWPTHGYIRVPRRVFQVIELQACQSVPPQP